MAFFDWNHDGKKDFTDDFIEYQVYKNTTNKQNYTPRSGGGISTFGAIVATIGGLLLAAASHYLVVEKILRWQSQLFCGLYVERD